MSDDYKQKISALSDKKVDEVLLTRDEIYSKLYRDHPFKIQRSGKSVLDEILKNKTIKNTFDL